MVTIRTTGREVQKRMINLTIELVSRATTPIHTTVLQAPLQSSQDTPLRCTCFYSSPPCSRDRFAPIISTRATLPVEIRILILRPYPQPFLDPRVALGFYLDTNSDSEIYSEYDSDSKDAPTPQPITWPPPRSLAQPTKLQHSAIPSRPLWPTQPLVHLVRENSPSEPKRTLPGTEEGPNGQAPVVLKYRAR